MDIPNLVKQAFMLCHNKDPEGLYPTEVDLLEFTRNLIKLLEKENGI